MARRRRERSPSDIRLKQPDRSGPTEGTLLQLAQERGLFEQAKKQQAANRKASGVAVKPSDADDDDGDDEAGLPPTAERILDTLLWTVSLAMLHFTLDVLVQNQYSIDRVQFPKVFARAGQALMVFALLFYPLHPHKSNPTILPGLPSRFQPLLRQTIFFATSVVAGCYLIYATNTFGYMALDLPWAVLSLAVAGTFLWLRGYDIK
ncbi:hypothetical protein B0H67DRAFT_603695 [Lasiosphaeris hirsuta]|uniref:DUF7719 domain-containing protein n=1 Tax=Lasiosphaeris hirsuta TaxID=260670 RepID=A0AA39ZW44_9PEZI|nr:hypothetical protein B0H67DRAFT_603695 [Lasiosphaeris hirsuta]